jgi:pimeloyl-ACP methyl ester carboxylesterase
MRSTRAFSQLHKICHQNRQINSSCCSVLSKHHLSWSVENNNNFRKSNSNRASNDHYYSGAVRSLSSSTIRRNDVFRGIQSLGKNHYHHLISATANTNNHSLRHFSYSAETETSIENAHAGFSLLKGLDVHTVSSEMDGHPLAVYTIQQKEEEDIQDDKSNRTPVLLLHGRTWSSVPVYHLVGEDSTDNNEQQEEGEEGNNFSLMEALYNTGHIQPYAMDFRGFGGTPKDEEGYVEPLKCVKDVVSVLKWIHSKNNEPGCQRPPALLGWSHGALIAQIVAQRHPEHLSKLILYSSIYNPNIKYSIPPPFETPMMQQQRQSQPPGHTDHDDFPLHEMTAPNEYDLAMADFTNYFDTFKPNTSSSSSSSVHRHYQPPKSAKLFANAALISDPIKVQWWNLHQLNECHPSQITSSTPTMVVVGDNDPYAPMVLQAELFTNLSRGVDRTWSIIANADHAVHLSEERGRFVQSVGSFVQNK